MLRIERKSVFDTVELESGIHAFLNCILHGCRSKRGQCVHVEMMEELKIMWI